MGLDTSAVGGPNMGSTNLYGHADYYRDKAAGKSDSELLASINANPGAMGNGGVGGDLYNMISRGASSGGGGGGGGGGGSSHSVGASAAAFTPASVDFNPGGIDMGSKPQWSNEDFIRGLARERSEEFTSISNKENSITNNIEQNIGNKGDWETNVDNTGTINNSLIGNDYSLNMGSINVANKQNQFGM